MRFDVYMGIKTIYLFVLLNYILYYSFKNSGNTKILNLSYKKVLNKTVIQNFIIILLYFW